MANGLEKDFETAAAACGDSRNNGPHETCVAGGAQSNEPNPASSASPKDSGDATPVNGNSDDQTAASSDTPIDSGPFTSGIGNSVNQNETSSDLPNGSQLPTSANGNSDDQIEQQDHSVPGNKELSISPPSPHSPISSQLPSAPPPSSPSPVQESAPPPSPAPPTVQDPPSPSPSTQTNADPPHHPPVSTRSSARAHAKDSIRTTKAERDHWTFLAAEHLQRSLGAHDNELAELVVRYEKKFENKVSLSRSYFISNY